MPKPEFTLWQDWIHWKDVAKALGDWVIKVRIKIIVTIKFDINLNWIRDIIAQVLAFFINLTINLVILALRFLRILVDIIACVIAILLAPVVLPIWYLWGSLRDAELFRLSTQGLGEINLLDLLWNAGASSWEKQVHESLWKQVENIYSIVPAAEKRIPSIRRMLQRTLFTLALQHLGVGMVVEATRTYLSNIIKWIDNQWKAAFQDQRSWFQKLVGDLGDNLGSYIESEIQKVRDYIDYHISSVKRPLDMFQYDLEHIEKKGINWKEFLPYGMVSTPLGRAILDLYNGALVVKQVTDDIWRGLLEPTEWLTDKKRQELAKLEKKQMIVSEIERVQDPTSPQSVLHRTELKYFEEA